ncbi:MAG: ABC-type transport auxiliary lipoprotein family protein [Roseiarcus sp.]|jgi:cholesterol transport system auxiliary component
MSSDPHSRPDSAARRGFALARRVCRLAGAFGAGAPTAAALALGLLLASCAGEPGAFDLNAAKPVSARPLQAQLRVSEPIAAIDLDSDRILVRVGPEQFATLAGARWSARLPLLVQSRLTQTFENAHLLGKVGGHGATTSADYDLDVEIRKFELDAAQMRVEADLAVKIVATVGGRVVAAEIFTAEAPVGSTDGAAVSAALDGALSSVMRRIVAFVSTRL